MNYILIISQQRFCILTSNLATWLDANKKATWKHYWKQNMWTCISMGTSTDHPNGFQVFSNAKVWGKKMIASFFLLQDFWSGLLPASHPSWPDVQIYYIKLSARRFGQNGPDLWVYFCVDVHSRSWVNELTHSISGNCLWVSHFCSYKILFLRYYVTSVVMVQHVEPLTQLHCHIAQVFL